MTNYSSNSFIMINKIYLDKVEISWSAIAFIFSEIFYKYEIRIVFLMMNSS
jgi:hypothetical protein